MPALGSISGGSLSPNPNFGASFGQGFNVGSAIQNRQLQAQQREEMQAKQARLQELGAGALSGSLPDLEQLALQDPQMTNTILGIFSRKDDAAANKLSVMTDQMGAFAASIIDAPQPVQRQRLLIEQQKLREEGKVGMADEMLRMAEMQPEQLYSELSQDIVSSKLTQGLMKNYAPAALETKVVNKQLLERQPNGEWKVVGGVDGGRGPQIPPVLLEGLDPSVAAKGSAAFEAAGGGDKGIKAFESIVASQKESVRRQETPQVLSTRYPNATSDEIGQLQSAIDSAPTVEKGLAAAETIRIQQRKNTKAGDVANRSLYLVDKILGNNELNDVLGSYEGQDDIMIPRSDAESEAIADIEEVANILTVPAMSLMSGILSESDIKMLKSIAGGAFNRKRGEKRFREDAGQIRTALKRASIATSLNARDREAFGWALKNRNNPKAKMIFKKIGVDDAEI